jgi:hypothetical protein
MGDNLHDDWRPNVIGIRYDSISCSSWGGLRSGRWVCCSLNCSFIRQSLCGQFTNKLQAVAIIQACVVLVACSHGFGRTVDEIQPNDLVSLQQVRSDVVIARCPVADQPQAVLWKQHSFPRRTGPFEGISCRPAPAAVRRQNAEAVLYRIFGFCRAVAVSFDLCRCLSVQSFTPLDLLG